MIILLIYQYNPVNPYNMLSLNQFCSHHPESRELLVTAP